MALLPSPARATIEAELASRLCLAEAGDELAARRATELRRVLDFCAQLPDASLDRAILALLDDTATDTGGDNSAP